MSGNKLPLPIAATGVALGGAPTGASWGTATKGGGGQLFGMNPAEAIRAERLAQGRQTTVASRVRIVPANGLHPGAARYDADVGQQLATQSTRICWW